MDRFAALRDRLHSVYRIQDDDTGLMALYLRAAARLAADIDSDANAILQSHWFDFADRALYDSWFLRSRAVRGLGMPAPDEPELLRFPYIHDLARVAALLGLSPWQEPPTARDVVETYRQRVGRIVEMYTHGPGTLGSLREIVEAQLPVDPEAPPGQADRPFSIEEFPAVAKAGLAAHETIEPGKLIGPLMRWFVDNDGLLPAPPAIYVEGLAPKPTLVDATENPSLELFGDFPRLAIGWRGTVPAGKTLRFQPVWWNWLGTGSGPLRAESDEDPAAPGPWTAAEDAPHSPVTVMLQTRDGALWAAAVADGSGSLWRCDGKAWKSALDGLGAIRCLAENGGDLLIGTANGLLRMPLDSGGPYAAQSVLPDPVNAIVRARQGDLWLATATGAGVFAGGTLTRSIEADVNDITQDSSGALFFGTKAGLAQYDPAGDAWFWYAGETGGEWVEGSAPPEKVFLPAVTRVLRGPDASLWIGTERGLARYTAQAERSLHFVPLLEAFPDLTDGRVHAIAADENGGVWFGADRGLFRYDGRDFWQFQGGAWTQLGACGTLYEKSMKTAAGYAPRGAWRFDRASDRWQWWNDQTRMWDPMKIDSRSTAEAAVFAIGWTDAARGDLGTGHGADFKPESAVELVARFKPDARTVVNGGIPAIPRLPAGRSVWRFLSMETDSLHGPIGPGGLSSPADHPTWTSEGRLALPPADPRGPAEGRFDIRAPMPPNDFDMAVFAYNPAAKVWLEWAPRRACTALVRLKARAGDEHMAPAVLDRVFQGMEQVRPAGVRVFLAVEQNIVRGNDNGTG